MPKNKPNKGLLKRVKITKSGRIKMGRAGGRHLRSHKSASLLRDYRKPIYAKAGDARRVRAMLFTKVSSTAQVRERDEQSDARQDEKS